jgi:hypothetical protein
VLRNFFVKKLLQNYFEIKKIRNFASLFKGNPNTNCMLTTAKSVNEVMFEIIELRKELATLSYNNPRYDVVEDQLHELEEQFESETGELVVDALADFYDEYCPDSEVLSPLAYLAKNYSVTGENQNGKTYEVAKKDALPIDMDDYPGQDNRLTLIPNPLRLVAYFGDGTVKEVWRLKK